MSHEEDAVQPGPGHPEKRVDSHTPIADLIVNGKDHYLVRLDDSDPQRPFWKFERSKERSAGAAVFRPIIGASDPRDTEKVKPAFRTRIDAPAELEIMELDYTGGHLFEEGEDSEGGPEPRAKVITDGSVMYFPVRRAQDGVKIPDLAVPIDEVRDLFTGNKKGPNNTIIKDSACLVELPTTLGPLFQAAFLNRNCMLNLHEPKVVDGSIPSDGLINFLGSVPGSLEPLFLPEIFSVLTDAIDSREAAGIVFYTPGSTEETSKNILTKVFRIGVLLTALEIVKKHRGITPKALLQAETIKKLLPPIASVSVLQGHHEVKPADSLALFSPIADVFGSAPEKHPHASDQVEVRSVNKPALKLPEKKKSFVEGWAEVEEQVYNFQERIQGLLNFFARTDITSQVAFGDRSEEFFAHLFGLKSDLVTFAYSKPGLIMHLPHLSNVVISEADGIAFGLPYLDDKEVAMFAQPLDRIPTYETVARNAATYWRTNLSDLRRSLGSYGDKSWGEIDQALTYPHRKISLPEGHGDYYLKFKSALLELVSPHNGSRGIGLQDYQIANLQPFNLCQTILSEQVLMAIDRSFSMVLESPSANSPQKAPQVFGVASAGSIFLEYVTG